MAGPGDGMAAGGVGHGYMRASSADRDRVIEVLKAAFVQGRLSQDELGARVGQTLTSRTYGELAAVTADIPAEAAAVRSAVTARPHARTPVSRVRATLWAACVVVPVTLLALTFVTGSGKLAFPFIISVFMSYVTAGTLLAEAWERKQEQRRLRRGPTPGSSGRPSRRRTTGTTAGRLPHTERARRHMARAAPRRVRRERRSGRHSPHHWRRAPGRCVIGCAGR